MKKKGRIVVTRKLPDSVETQITKLFDTKLNSTDNPFTKKQLLEAATWADVMVVTFTDQIDKEIFKAASPNLKLIANFGVGVDHIDLEMAQTFGIQVSNTPDVLTEDTADLAMALILMASRRFGEGERMVRAGKWNGWTPTQLMGHRVHSRSLGIIGMGRIGQALALRALGFGMSINYHNRKRIEVDIENKLKAKYWNNLDQMIGSIDILSINAPLTPDTTKILSAARLERMRSNSILINTARGGLVDEEALIRILKKGPIAAAGLDVFDREPMVNPQLVQLENVVLLPHLGSATKEGRIAMGERVILNAMNVVNGRPPPDKVIF